jgi:hypothetical protein
MEHTKIVVTEGSEPTTICSQLKMEANDGWPSVISRQNYLEKKTPKQIEE